MSQPGTLRIWTGLVLGYVLVAGACTYAFEEPREFLAVAAMPPFVLAHLLHQIHLPGMLEHGGRCGWGWCAPTGLGWVFAITLMCGASWLLAKALASIWRRARS